ncbi:MAG: glycine cleavage system aminomethyltransferase GcvT [Candidatus Thorarchaeota archaeon]|nr:MAG: glycine cleavage system aminomethyltransferase GcvT [Candidatus Thorarchaeota archaeon]
MNDRLERTQLYDWHKEHGDVVPFAGWEMPVRYSDIREEHMAVREAVGVFDVSHMLRMWIEGPDSVDFLQTVTSNNVRTLNINGGQYSTCLNENGGTFDDLMLYRIGEEEFIWVTNAANGAKIWAHLQEQAKKLDVKVLDKTKEIAMIAIQGPKALSLLSKMSGKNMDEFGRFTCNPLTIAGYDTYLCRTGYTGEAGAEVLVLNCPFTDEGKERAIGFWNELLDQGAEFGVKPCGLGARDSTRLEAGFVLYGHELDEETSPIEARIPYAVKFKVEPHYIGYDVVQNHKNEGVKKTRIGFVMIDKGIPREKYPILFNSSEIGMTTSGGISPITNKGIGMGYVNPNIVNDGDIIEIDIKGRHRRAEVTKWPFYDTEKYGETRTA